VPNARVGPAAKRSAACIAVSMTESSSTLLRLAPDGTVLLRQNGTLAAFDWETIDALTPLGGVRVEDNVVVTESGPRNLTREQLAD